MKMKMQYFFLNINKYLNQKSDLAGKLDGTSCW